MEPKRKSSQVAKQLNKLIPVVQASLLTICLLTLTSPLSDVSWACAPAPPELESASIANEEASLSGTKLYRHSTLFDVLTSKVRRTISVS
jgi:hypothetical protein